jgi:soluble lytic murein transglycosylase
MKVPYASSGRAGLVSRGIAGLLAVLISSGPVYGRESGNAAGPSENSSVSHTKKTASTKSGTGKSKAAGKAGKSAAARKKSRRRGTKAQRMARTARIKQAFVASTELRPMAQQLMTLRTPAAYAGVAAYAHRQTGDAAAAAYLALGRAYLLDKRYSDATTSLRQVRQNSEVLSDYADYLAAEAEHNQGNEAGAEALLHGFNDRHPDSIFDIQAPELEANVLLAEGNATGAQHVLAAVADEAADLPNYELTQGKIAFALGRQPDAEQIFKKLLLSHPLSGEAGVARAKLTAMGVETNLTSAELRSLGDAFYNAGRFAEAGEEYHALARNATLDPTARNGFAVAAAACDLKLKRLTDTQARSLADTHDENGARRLYLLMEMARNRNDEADLQRIVAQLKSDFPQSPWLAEALFSSGNMYLLKKDYASAASYYGDLAMHFPSHKNAASAHWRAGWLDYRQGLYSDAARIFDEQIKLFPNATETAAALYWRGRLFETQESNRQQAATNYRTVSRVYQHFFYAQMARQRLQALGEPLLVSQSQSEPVQAPPVPHLADTFPADSPHIAKARLVANAGLNDYIAQEIAADPDSDTWSALAEAQLYASFGESYRAMRALKRALPYATSASINSIPLAYWRILFPEAWWDTIKTESAKNGLDPYLVASLIRQESEFNPGAISYANAYGLMQLLPSVGKSLAKDEGMTHFETFQLLDPQTNIRLGTRYLRKMLDRFGGVQEYALAAYNAGDERVADWQAAGPYHGIDEFVESIPFTQTREYVQGILRNEDIYRSIDAVAGTQSKTGIGASR